MSFDTTTGAGAATVTTFEFFGKGPLVNTNFVFQAIGGNLALCWGGSIFTAQIVQDASGLYAALEIFVSLVTGTIDQAYCTSLICVTLASDGINKGRFPIGPAPIAASSFNTASQTGFGATLGQLSLGTDDGIGGSPMNNGPFSGFNANFDITSLTLSPIPATVQIPAAAWLFSTGLLGLIDLVRRRKI